MPSFYLVSFLTTKFFHVHVFLFFIINYYLFYCLFTCSCSFHSLEDRLSGVATNTTSSVKTLTFDLQRIQDKLQSVERLRDRLEDFQAEWKKEKTTMEEERREKTSEMMEVIQSLKKKQNEEGVGHGEAMPSLKEVSEEVAIHKKKFEVHYIIDFIIGIN